MGRRPLHPRCQSCGAWWRRMSQTQPGRCQVCTGELKLWQRLKQISRKRRPKGHLCAGCGVRWKQGKDGLCRSCQHEMGIEVATAAEREAAHLTAEQRTLARLRRPIVPRERRVVVVDGVAYEVESSSERVLEDGELERELSRARNGRA